jgi:hypothetical protein
MGRRRRARRPPSPRDFPAGEELEVREGVVQDVFFQGAGLPLGEGGAGAAEGAGGREAPGADRLVGIGDVVEAEGAATAGADEQLTGKGVAPGAVGDAPVEDPVEQLRLERGELEAPDAEVAGRGALAREPGPGLASVVPEATKALGSEAVGEPLNAEALQGEAQGRALGRVEAAEQQLETVAAEVAGLELVAVARQGEHLQAVAVKVGRGGEGAGDGEGEGSVLGGEGVAILEAGGACIAGGDAKASGEEADRLERVEAPLPEVDIEMLADPGGGVSGQLVDLEVVEGSAEDGSDHLTSLQQRKPVE